MSSCRNLLPTTLLTAVVVAIAWKSAAWAEPLSGSVVDGQTLEPVADARITISATATESAVPQKGDEVPQKGDQMMSATTNRAGQYVFTDVPVGKLILRVEAEGYATSEEAIEVGPGGRTDLVLVLFPPGLASEIIEITDQIAPQPTPPGKTELARKELTRIPGTRGDALTSIKSLPGVANADGQGAGPGLLVIRGSAPEDSKVTIDGIEIPLLYHFFGLQSIVPSEFIGSIDFLPGGFGPSDGRATGGIINIVTRDEVVKETDGFAELSFINVAGFVKGPISRKYDLQFAAGVRRSAIDLLLPAVLPDDANISFTTAPQYYDAQARVDWRPRYSDRVTLLGLASFDLLSLLNDNINPNEPLLSGKWENETSFTRTILSWVHRSKTLENRLVAAVGTTGFRFEIGADMDEGEQSETRLDDRFLRFDQRRLELREDLAWKLSTRLTLRGGGDVVFQSTDAEVKFPSPPQEGSGGPDNFSTAPLVEIMDVLDEHVASAYLAADVRPISGTTITPGLRVDYFDRIGETTWSPRVAVQQAISADWTLRLSMGSYSRAPQQNEAFQTTLLPELATQYVAGVDYKIAEGISIQSSAFYTDRRHLIVQDEVTAASDPENSYVNRGFGRSFGAELLLRAKHNQFFGWLAYTLSRSDRIDGPEAERRLFDYDQTHNLIAVASYRLGGWEFGGRWQFSTGAPYTPIVSSIFLSDTAIHIPVYGVVNSERFASAHQLDLRIDRKWTFKTWSLSAYLDVTNVYANPRTLGYQYNFDYSERKAIEELPVVPALGVRGSF
ncbi:MAG: TonB-dependent receptor [Proteobacteria bacterium]|nr:TonB-dependent receptor [Pseudomonadota bacterium]